MILLNWYSYSLSGFLNWIAKLCDLWFKGIIALSGIPNMIIISIISILFLTWMLIMRWHDSRTKDKGLRE